MSTYTYADRMLLLKAMIVRRVPRERRIASAMLMTALQADQELVRERTPQYYFSDWRSWTSSEVNSVLEQELIDDGINKKTGHGPPVLGYIRTRLGDIFLLSLEPRLAMALDEMPMSDVAVLDFLSLL
ncbi:MAG: hypothetical protein AB7L09_03175 [Nitrospira sp.]